MSPKKDYSYFYSPEYNEKYNSWIKKYSSKKRVGKGSFFQKKKMEKKQTKKERVLLEDFNRPRGEYDL